MLDQKAETLFSKVDEIHKGKRANLDRQAEETKLYVENIKTSVQLSKTLVDQGTEEEIISSQKMMLDNANNLLANREEYFKAPIPVAKLSYTSSTSKEPINEEILRGLANSLGDVNEGSKDTGSQGCKSNLNPKAPAFSTSGSHSSISYHDAVTRNMTKGEDQSKNTDPKARSRDDKCSICLCDFTDKKTLSKCDHSFCAGCIDEAFQHQKKCPVCSQVYGPLIGNQPSGKMIVSYSSINLSGYESCGSIVITYKFDDGVQGPEHPNPGKRYVGTTRTAFLPDNEEGNKVLKLLKKAFCQKLTLTIGRSSTSGANNVITWNDIHHKTRRTGGPTSFGYPDPDYLKRVQDELAAKGITE